MVKIIDLHFQGVEGLISAYLEETEEGLVLIEPGPTSTLPTLLEGIRAAGHQPEDIVHVFVTHVHLDHAGAAWYFANELGIPVHVHPLGALHLIDPGRLWRSAAQLYGDKMDSLWGEMRPIDPSLVFTHQHQEKIRVGTIWVKTFYTPGHADHHVAWRVGRHMFAGDVAGIKFDNGIATVPTPPPEVNVKAWTESIRLLKDVRPETIYMTHGGLVENHRTHLIEVEGRLRNFETFVRTHLENGAQPKSVVDKFVDFYERQLDATKMSEELKFKYMNMGGPKLSALGMIRYVSKDLGLPKPSSRAKIPVLL